MKNPLPTIRRISIDQLQPGMFLVKVDRSWLDTPFLFTKRLLKSTKSIDQLRQCGVKEAWIDLSRGAGPVEDGVESDVKHSADPDSKQNMMEALDRYAVGSETIQDLHPPASISGGEEMRLSSAMPTDRDFQQAGRVLDDAVNAVEALFAGVKSGTPLHALQTKQIVCDLLEQVTRSETALLHLMRLFALKDFDYSLYQHAVDVCVMAMVLAVEGGLSRQKVEDLGVGALLHDIGYVRLPRNLLRKRVPLSRQEQLVLDRHTDIGCEIVSGAPGLPHSVETVISQHHERLDGSGFPQGMKKNLLSQDGLLVAIVDHYEGLVTKRYGREPLLPAQAIRELYRLGQLEHLDPAWVDRFIRVIGVYPIGSLVELNSGERAIVVSENPENQTRPRIHVITDPHEGTFFSMDLADAGSNSSLKIVGYLNPDKEKINLAKFLGCPAHRLESENNDCDKIRV